MRTPPQASMLSNQLQLWRRKCSRGWLCRAYLGMLTRFDRACVWTAVWRPDGRCCGRARRVMYQRDSGAQQQLSHSVLKIIDSVLNTLQFRAACSGENILAKIRIIFM